MSEDKKIKYERPKVISLSGMEKGSGQLPCTSGSSAAGCFSGTSATTPGCVPGTGASPVCTIGTGAGL